VSENSDVVEHHASDARSSFWFVHRCTHCLTITGHRVVEDVAVDAAGDIDVADLERSLVVKPAAGSRTSTTMPFTGPTKGWASSTRKTNVLRFSKIAAELGRH
jgi:hypothetical protein